MKEITLPKASQLTSPNPVTVVCTQKPDGSTNLATVSWWTYPLLQAQYDRLCHGKDFLQWGYGAKQQKDHPDHSRRADC